MRIKKNQIIVCILLLGFLLGLGLPNDALADSGLTNVTYRYLRVGDSSFATGSSKSSPSFSSF